MPDFPFEAVHEHFAKPLAGFELGPDDMAPVMAFVRAEGAKLVQVDVIPEFVTNRFFSGPDGKTALGQFIRDSLAKMSELFPDGGIVVLCEAYFKEVRVENENDKKKLDAYRNKGSLADDPEADECVMISIYSTKEMRIARLPISAGRIVEYRELEPFMASAGRLTLNPEEEDLPNGAKYQ